MPYRFFGEFDGKIVTVRREPELLSPLPMRKIADQPRIRDIRQALPKTPTMFSAVQTIAFMPIRYWRCDVRKMSRTRFYYFAKRRKAWI